MDKWNSKMPLSRLYAGRNRFDGGKPSKSDKQALIKSLHAISMILLLVLI